MKKITLLYSFLLIGLSACATPSASQLSTNSTAYQDTFVFVEGGVEFAVYPDGQFDFYYNPYGNYNRAPGRNFSYNAGNDYRPFLQFDDYGAVIQIENVPVYYDYYGRISQAGNIRLNYNSYGMLTRIGRMKLHYNRYQQFTHASGHINSRNRNYIARPWHQYFQKPSAQFVVLYQQPYRAYYVPNRVSYTVYKNYYQNNKNNFRRSYYNPGDNVVSYHRGNQSEQIRNIRTQPHWGTNNKTRNERTVRSASGKKVNTPVENNQNRRPVRNSRNNSKTPENHSSHSVRNSANNSKTPESHSTRSVRKSNSKTNTTKSPAVRKSKNTRNTRSTRSGTKSSGASKSVSRKTSSNKPAATSTRNVRSTRGRNN